MVAYVGAVVSPLGFTGLAAFGQDALLQFHRQIGHAGLAFILVHFAISAHWDEVTPAKALARAM